MPSESTKQDLFSSDKPIESREKDKLDRRRFADRVAQAIRGWSDRESLVIGLYGPWGNGKTSVKNMIVEAVREGGGLLVIEFNPWQRANRNQLSEAFFDEIGVALGRGPLASKKDDKAAARKWKQYASRLRASGDLLKHLRTLFTVILIAVILSSPLTFANQWFILVPVATALVGVALLWSSKVIQLVGEFIAVGADQDPLEDVKAALGAVLKPLTAPILIVVDDIDRLVPAELMEMLQLVKANADFPNMVCCLICDRAIVEANIDAATRTKSGRGYLEKIVQVAFELP